jgi:hypothetical protein
MPSFHDSIVYTFESSNKGGHKIGPITIHEFRLCRSFQNNPIIQHIHLVTFTGQLPRSARRDNSLARRRPHRPTTIIPSSNFRQLRCRRRARSRCGTRHSTRGRQRDIGTQIIVVGISVIGQNVVRCSSTPTSFHAEDTGEEGHHRDSVGGSWTGDDVVGCVSDEIFKVPRGGCATLTRNSRCEQATG